MEETKKEQHTCIHPDCENYGKPCNCGCWKGETNIVCKHHHKINKEDK